MSEFEERETEAFMKIYFTLRESYSQNLKMGADHYQSKKTAFEHINELETMFFWEQLRSRDMTLYDCLRPIEATLDKVPN